MPIEEPEELVTLRNEVLSTKAKLSSLSDDEYEKSPYAKHMDLGVLKKQAHRYVELSSKRQEYIKLFFVKQKAAYDIVIGSRFVEKKKPYSMRMIGSRLIAGAIRITTGMKMKDPTSGMRMFNRTTMKECAMNMNYGPEPDTVSYLIKNGAKVAEVQAEMDERIAGESYLNAITSAIYMARMLTSILVIQNFRKRAK
jgi:hypothetical protein